MTVDTVLTDRELEMVELSDLELVTKLYALVNEIEVEDEQHRDDFFWLIGEATERWCPAAAWAERQANARAQFDDDEELARELGATCERWRDRWNVRMMRAALRA